MTEPDIWHAYVDGELSTQEKANCQALVEQSCECRSAVVSIESLKNFTRTNAAEIHCEKTWEHCCGRLHELERTTKADRFIARYAWGICGVLFISIIGGGMVNRMNGGSHVDSAAFMQNAASLGPSIAPSSKDRAQGDWVAEILGEARSVINANNIRVKGLEIGDIAGFPAKKLLLEDNAGTLSLLLTDVDLAVDGMEPVEGSNVYLHTGMGIGGCVRWRMNGRTFFLIGNRSTESLVAVAEKLHP